MLSVAISISPNPVGTSFRVNQLETSETYQTGIYDMNGKLLGRKALSYPFEVSADGLAKGTYLLILQDANGARATRKFVKK